MSASGHGPHIVLPGGDAQAVGGQSTGAMWAELCALRAQSEQIVNGVETMVELMRELLAASREMIAKGDEMKLAGGEICEHVAKSKEAVEHLSSCMGDHAEPG